MNPSVEALEDQYYLLKGSLASFIAQGATPAQIDALQTQIVRARRNYWAAINATLHDDDPAVRDLTSELNLLQQTLPATIEHMNDVAKVLDAITQAVDVGAKLVSLAV